MPDLERPPQKQDKQINFRLPDTLKQQLEKIAEKEDRSIAYIVRKMIEDAIMEN